MTPWKEYRGKLNTIMDECTDYEIPTHLIMMEKAVFDMALEKSGLFAEYYTELTEYTEYSEYEDIKPKQLN